MINKTRFTIFLGIIFIIFGVSLLVMNINFKDKSKTYEENYIKFQEKVLQLDKQIEEYKKSSNEQNILTRQLDDQVNLTNELSYQNAQFENQVKTFMAVGSFPKKYDMPEKLTDRGSYERYRSKMEFVGEWLGTYYAPISKECSNDKGITKSGLPVVPGKTIAIDERYWKLGTKFYIEGIGIVDATDTGNMVKGKERFDLCVFSTHISNSGSFKAKVWMIKE